MLEANKTSPAGIWLNAHAFAEHVLGNGRALPWGDVVEFSEAYKKLQGILQVDRISVPLMGFLDNWLESNPQVLQRISGKNRVRFAIKKLLTDESLRQSMTEWMTACCAVVEADLLLEIPSNTALILWAHTRANPGVDTEPLGELDVDSCSVYLADTVRHLKPAGIAGVVSTVSDADLKAGAREELYRPIANVADNYRWVYAFRKPVASGSFMASGRYCLGDDRCSDDAGLISLPAEFWRTDAESPPQPDVEWIYSELPAFAEPETVRSNIALLRNWE